MVSVLCSGGEDALQPSLYSLAPWRTLQHVLPQCRKALLCLRSGKDCRNFIKSLECQVKVNKNHVAAY